MIFIDKHAGHFWFWHFADIPIALLMSAFGGKADIDLILSNVRF
jgi:hypothetical protein